MKEINKRIALGQQYAQIAKDLKLDWWDVRKSANKGWQGTKVQITNRLKKMSKENDPNKRAELVQEIGERVTYLYEGGRAMGKTIEKAQKALNG